MKTSFVIRFAVAAVLISIGCFLLLAEFSGTGMCFGLATFFFMPRSELHRPIPRSELWVMSGVLIAFVAVIIACKYFVPVSVGDSIQRVIRHPAIVVPLWLFMLWGLYRHWQRQRGESNAEQSGCTEPGDDALVSGRESLPPGR